jgi:ring-1,2-phenylacetyl-CoA epoxidase subunit PaaE
MKFYTLKVVGINTETNDTVTVLFRQPGLKRINYLAGQYLSVIFRINGRRYIRPYSFSSAPGVENTLNITIKKVPGGVVSNHIIDSLNVDDLVEVMEPMGDFVLNDNENDIYLWGAGSGITPLISIAKYALYINKNKNITLAYGNRHFENIIFKKEIAKLADEFKDRFTTKHFITQPYLDDFNPDIIQSRITKKEVKEILNNNKGDLNNALHYICGPVGLKESVKLVLSELGVGGKNIFAEDFEVIRNPKDFEGVHTQNVSISLNGITASVEVTAGKSILEAGLDAGMDLSYSCQTGNCLVCRGRIIEGNVKMIGVAQIPAGLGAGECLLCSSFPLTAEVKIEVE